MKKSQKLAQTHKIIRPFTQEKKVNNNSPRWTIPKDQNNHRNTHSPSPNKYHPSFTQISNKFPAYTIASKFIDYQSIKNQILPGPDRYNPIPSTDVNRHFPAADIVGREVQKDIVQSPGPTTYDSKISALNQHPSGFITTAKKNFIINNQSPGPGEYNITSNLLKPMSFSKAEKIDKEIDFPVGPGAYEPNIYVKVKGTPLIMPETKSPIIHNEENLPGPTAYNVDLSKIKVKSQITIFGKDQRTRSTSQQLPGPNQYYPIKQLENAPRALIGNAKRFIGERISKSPGPQEYIIPDGTKGPKFSIRQKKEDKKQISEEPDCWSYNIFAKEVKRSASFGTSSRFTFTKIGFPGPGQYNQTLSSIGNGVSIGKSKKLQQILNENPGPTHYVIRAFTEIKK